MESGLGFYVEYVATIYRENMYVCTLSTEVPKAIKLHSFGSTKWFMVYKWAYKDSVEVHKS